MGEQIITTCGKVILVDEDDYPLLSRHSWQMAGGDYASTKMPREVVNRCYTIYLHKLVIANFGFGGSVASVGHYARWECASRRLSNGYEGEKTHGKR